MLKVGSRVTWYRYRFGYDKTKHSGTVKKVHSSKVTINLDDGRTVSVAKENVQEAS